MRPHVVHCRAPKRNAKRDREQCGGFVARVPWPFRVVGILKHSCQARAGSYVAGCLWCGAIHEIQKEDDTVDRSVRRGVA